ncbi:ankyrin repeat domain-containing protein [Aspergillus lucknowensis]|uniref:Ankyrin repeat-containing domain protein n=1 Tax=Aspergillus lucknowensis TaxID=176173 RepID=A0ABR4M1A3_9EURO
MELLALPNDVLLLIAEAVDAQADLSRLTRTNRDLYCLLSDFLYRNNIRKFGSSAMFWAAEEGRIDTMRRMLDLGASLDDTTEFTTPLELAAFSGQEEMVKFLLDRGATYGFWRCRPWTPLCAAAVEGHTGVVKILLERDCAARKSHREGKEPEQLSGPAFFCRNRQDALIKTMFLKDPVTAQNPRAEYSIALFMAIAGGQDATARALIESRKPDLDYKDGEQRTALMWALSHCRYETITTLMNHGADPNLTDFRGQTVLHAAAFNGDVYALGRLLQYSAVDPNCRDIRNQTPLLDAGRKLNPQLSRMLLQRPDTDANCRGNDGRNPLHIAIHSSEPATVERLLDRPGIDLDARDQEGRTPLSLAVQLGDTVTTKSLLARCANADLADGEGRTPLSWVAEMGDMQVLVRLTLVHAVQLDTRDNNGWTPLFWAAKAGYWLVVKFLLYLGADAHQRDNEGNTALICVAMHCRIAKAGHDRVTRLLLDNGVDPNVQDKNGRTAFSHASELRNYDVVVALLGAGKPRTPSPPDVTQFLNMSPEERPRYQEETMRLHWPEPASAPLPIEG